MSHDGFPHNTAMGQHIEPPIKVTKKDLRLAFADPIARYMEQHYDGWKRDGHKLWFHATNGLYKATIVYEGTEWAYDFCDHRDGSLEVGYDWWEFEALSSYEISCEKVIAG